MLSFRYFRSFRVHDRGQTRNEIKKMENIKISGDATRSCAVVDLCTNML